MIEAADRDGPDWFPAASTVTVLVLEDELMIAIELATLIAERGGEVVGPFATVEAAKRSISTKHIDGAVVDLDLNGQLSTDVLTLLEQARVPFVIYSGMDAKLLSLQAKRTPWVQKPTPGADVVERLFMEIEGVCNRAA